MKLDNKNFCLILGCTINPNRIQNLIRKDQNLRLEDYKIALKKWLKNSFANKVIVIENSGYDLSELIKISEEYKSEKKIEFLSNDLNNHYPPELGKGYGESIILKEAINNSSLLKESDAFVHVSGRYYVKNFKSFIKEFILSNSDIFLNISDNLKYSTANIYAGKKEFLIKYLLPESEKVNDAKNYFFENCVASAALKAILNNYKFEIPKTYPIIEGIIGTNNKKYKYNIYQKLKLLFFGKLKNYFFKTKKY
tara:strand:+ start:1598 stop:2353 length:756 start_codon:yes stop_codon:yes gene_type:complete